MGCRQVRTQDRHDGIDCRFNWVHLHHGVCQLPANAGCRSSPMWYSLGCFPDFGGCQIHLRWTPGWILCLRRIRQLRMPPRSAPFNYEDILPPTSIFVGVSVSSSLLVSSKHVCLLSAIGHGESPSSSSGYGFHPFSPSSTSARPRHGGLCEKDDSKTLKQLLSD